MAKLIFWALLLCLTASCGRPAQFRQADGAVWNTTYHIVYNAPEDLRDSIVSVMKQVERSLSPFAKGSLISRVNAGDSTARADSLLRKVMDESKRINGLSGGAFDPTVAPLVNLWGFGYKNNLPDPTQNSIDSLLLSVGIADCSITPDGRIVKKSHSTEFNFSAITKGYGVDLVGEMLKRNGATDYMVEIGGEIALHGLSPRHKLWSVMVDAPVEADTVVHERLTIIDATDCGIATSGNYRNFKHTAEGDTWHTISPKTGRPAVTDIRSATVIAPCTMTADALATSCMAMPASQALAMIENIEGVEALFVVADSVGHTDTIVATSGFPAMR